MNRFIPLFLLVALLLFIGCSLGMEQTELDAVDGAVLWTPPPVQDPEPLVRPAEDNLTGSLRYTVNSIEESNCPSLPCESIVDECDMTANMHAVAFATVVSAPVFDDTCPRPYRFNHAELTLRIDDVIIGVATPQRLTAYGAMSANGYARYNIGDHLLVNLRRTKQEWWVNRSIQIVMDTDENFALEESSELIDLPTQVSDLQQELERRRTDPNQCNQAWLSDEEFNGYIRTDTCDSDDDRNVEDHTGPEFDDRSEGGE